jgi:glycosyltransferase involved in cell wall biosynthesis
MDQCPVADAQNQLLSVVIPIFCEADHLSGTLAAVRQALAQCDLRFELLLVDDGSSDTTWQIVAGEAQAFPAVRALRLSRNFGKEAALCAGLEHARGDAVIVMDADGQHPPSLLPDLVRTWQTSGADIAMPTLSKPLKPVADGNLCPINSVLWFFTFC